jgi:hypothetical protein
MRIFRHRVVRKAAMGVAGALLAALVASLGVRLAGARELAGARDRFEVEVGPLPAPEPAMPAAGGKREPAFIRRLGGLARLPAAAELMRIRQLVWRPPSTWSPAEVDGCRRFLAANASLLAASDRAAERRDTALIGARVNRPLGSADPGPLLPRAGAQATLLKARIRLALLDRSSVELHRGMEALAAEAPAPPGGVGSPARTPDGPAPGSSGLRQTSFVPREERPGGQRFGRPTEASTTRAETSESRGSWPCRLSADRR